MQVSKRVYTVFLVWLFGGSTSQNNRHFTIQGSGVLGSSYYYCVQRRGRALACFVKSTLLFLMWHNTTTTTTDEWN
jgi:hypothetical protein